MVRYLTAEQLRATRRRRWGTGGLSANGYRKVRSSGSQAYLHRLIAAELLGRPLRRVEDVHHRDGDPLNNNPLNLQVLRRGEHRRSHCPPRPLVHLCPVCGRPFARTRWSKSESMVCSPRCSALYRWGHRHESNDRSRQVRPCF